MADVRSGRELKPRLEMINGDAKMVQNVRKEYGELTIEPVEGIMGCKE